MAMPSLPAGGMDVFYIDESTAPGSVFAFTAICVPFLRLQDFEWRMVWEEHLKGIREWRRRASKRDGLRVAKELHASKLASGRGRFRHGTTQYTRVEAAQVYRALLADIDFLPQPSVLSVVSGPGSILYGHSQLEASLIALFQRMRTSCERSERLGLVFFDEGHGEYRQMYRKARVYLPTGSRVHNWGSGTATKNLPLDNFVKDANFKDSRHCLFTQLADIIAYAPCY